MVDSEVLFRRLLAVSIIREMSIHHCLTNWLLSYSHFSDDGTMQKATTGGYAKKLEFQYGETQVLEESNNNHTACIIDWMDLLQALEVSTFYII